MRIFATLVLLPKFQNELVANNFIFMWILRLFIVNGWICEKKQTEGTGRHASMQNFFRMFRLHFFFQYQVFGNFLWAIASILPQ